MTYDATVSTESIEAIWRMWRKRLRTILVPGHDIPIVQEEDRTAYLGKRDATIYAWFGDDLETITSFELVA